MKLLLERLITKKDEDSTVHIIYDNHTTKVGSVNSMEEYLKVFFLFDKNFNIAFDFQSMDSDDKHAYPVQAADYVANALYGFYEHKDDAYFNCFSNIINKKIMFPLGKFGT